MAERDRTDRLLDRALSEYSQASPRNGLEGRVLARLQAQPNPDRTLQWWWIALPAMTALMVIALIVAWHTEPKTVDIATAPPARLGVQPAPSAIEQTPPRESVMRRPLQPRHPKTPARISPKTRDSEPRLATFPARDSDDQLVKLAMQFVQAHPDKAKEMVQEQKEFREMAEAFTAPLNDEK